MMEKESELMSHPIRDSPLTCQDRSPEQRQQTENFSDTSKTHNSWQPSDSFLFSYPLLSPGPPLGLSLWPGAESWSQPSPPACLWENTGPAPERRSLGPWSVVCSLSPGPASQSEWTLPWRRKWWITQRWASHRYFVTIAVYCGE